MPGRKKGTPNRQRGGYKPLGVKTGRVEFRLSPEYQYILDEVCRLTQNNKTRVFQEAIRCYVLGSMYAATPELIKKVSETGYS